MGMPINTLALGQLSVKDSAIPRNPFNLDEKEALGLNNDVGLGQQWIGQYAEPRLVYTSSAFRSGTHKTCNRRTVHLAVDIFAEQGHTLYAPLDGVVETLENRNSHLNYGGMLILQHQTPLGSPFYTLYGHLNPEVVTRLSVGQQIAKGEALCQLGGPAENGGWPPHVHFQYALTTTGMGP